VPIRRSHHGWVALLLLPGLAAAALLDPPSSASFSLPRHSVDGGAGKANSASFVVQGTIGQADAGAMASSASFDVRGGFHRPTGAGESGDGLFADGFEDQASTDQEPGSG